MFPPRDADLVHADLFGGRGEVRVWNLSKQRLRGPFQVALACDLAPGASVGPHVQKGVEEIIVFVAGQGRVAVGGREVLVEPGAIVSLPEGTTLAIANTSDVEPLHYLIVKAVSGPLATKSV